MIRAALRARALPDSDAEPLRKTMARCHAGRHAQNSHQHGDHAGAADYDYQ
jgi:hypothetical protein